MIGIVRTALTIAALYASYTPAVSQPATMRDVMIEIQVMERLVAASMQAKDRAKMAVQYERLKPYTEWYQKNPQIAEHIPCGKAIFNLTLFSVAGLLENPAEIVPAMTRYGGAFQQFMPTCERILGLPPTREPNLR